MKAFTSLPLARLALTAVCSLTLAIAAQAQSVATQVLPPAAPGADARWEPSLDAFAAADKANAPAPGGVLFVGSSSIRLWADLPTSFPSEPVIVQRGFGGSRLADCVHYLNRLVLPYKPRLVIVYAGDNDLAEGATPQQVAALYQDFVRGVHAELPGTRIAFLSIKPSPLREGLLPEIREANALVARYTRSDPSLDYIDVYSKMLGPDGRPRTDLYRADALHLNAEGYALWTREISPHLTH